jgi:hypothetical protein
MRPVVPSPWIWRAEPDPGIRGLVQCQPGSPRVAPGSWTRGPGLPGPRDLSDRRGHEYSTRGLRTHLIFPISRLYKQPRRPIDLQKTLLSDRGDEGEVGKSGISSDSFSFRALRQVLDVAHHFRQMGITGKKVTGSWSKACPVHSEPKSKSKNQSCAGDGTSLKKPVAFCRFGQERLLW